MSLVAVLAIGGVVHACIGAGVFFAPDEPHKTQIFVTTTLKGLLVCRY
jgi:hypothetical protein